MSIRLTLAAVFVLLLSMLGGLVYVSRLVAENQENLARVENRRYESFQLADELRQSSDDLTRMARTYVLTDNDVYERYFNDVLAIRNGTKPRPTNYNRIYWDLVAVGRTPCPDGPAIALEQRMRDLQFTEEEFEILREAQARSDALVRLENQAMNAVKGRFDDGQGNFTLQKPKDLSLARNIMFGPEYHLAKADIMEPINDFLAHIEIRTDGEVQVLRDRAKTLANLQLMLAISATIFTAVAFVFLSRKVIRALLQLVDTLQDIAQGEGDLTRRVDENRRDELGTLGRWFNTFVGQVQDIVRTVSRSTLEVTTTATQVAGSARQQDQVVQNYGGSTNQAAAAVEQISSTIQVLTRTMSDVNGMARRTGEKASVGQARLAQLDAAMSSLSESTGQIDAKIEGIRDSVSRIHLATNTMITVADQTNLLSVNAAVEAEKAGDAGRGFRVVAREVRRLAEHSAKATLEIETMVQGIQDSVSGGVAEMDRFRQGMHDGIRQIEQIAQDFGEIADDVANLTSRIDDVNEMMVAQSSGTQQIRDSITQINDGVKQIGASVAEFTIATDRLQQVACGLRDQVSAFRIESGT